MPLVCGRQLRATSLWLWWYSGMFLAGFGYLFWRAVVKCGEFNTSAWRTADRPVLELYVYIVLVVISVVCVPLFIISSLVRVDNMANDGVKLGRDGVREALGKAHTEEEDRQESVGKCRGAWQRLGPVAPALHVVTAFCLLLPRVLLEAQEIRHQLLPRERIWSTELDFLFGTDRITPFNFTSRVGRSHKVDQFSRRTAHVNFTVYQPIALQLTSNVASQNEAGFSSSFPIVSPEFINYIIALCIYSVRYPAVFWFTNKGFTLLFSTQLLAAVVNYIFCHCGFSIMYKYSVSHDGVLTTMPLAIPHSVIVILSVLACTFVFFSSISIFNLGYFHFHREYRTFLRTHRVQVATEDLDGCCHGYAPHCMASIMLLLIATCKAPLIYCYITWYHVTRDSLVMTCIIVDILYLLLWIILWLGFTVKQSWKFYIIKPFVKIYTIPNDHGHCDDVISRPYSSSSFNSDFEPDTPRHIDTPSDEGIRVDSSTEIDQVDHIGSVTSAKRHVTDQPSDLLPQPNGEPEMNRTSASALRRSGVRKQKNNNVRVTFENYEATHPGDSPHETLRSVKYSAPEPRRPVSADPTEVPMRRHPQDPPLSRDNPNRRSDPGPRSPIFPGCEQIKPRFFNETPENTLTRNYRNSIRSKCDQYYINIDASPNKIQSSPVLSHKNSHQSNISDSRTRLDERTVGYHSSNGKINARNESPPRDIHSRQMRSRDETDVYRSISGSNRQLTSDQFARDLSRELKIITKPEMGRRDSAVPSSNETSSNDSEDPNVLCSQV